MFNLVRLRSAAPYTVAERVYDSLCVGRSPQNELVTSDRLVSSSHARLFVRDTALQVVDLDSRNGTEVNGARLQPFEPRELRQGDVVEFAGRLAFRVEVEREAAYAVIAVGAAAPAPPTAEDGVLRTLALPPGLTPVLDAGRLLSLQRLVTRLTDPLAQRNGGAWLEELATGAARVLKVPEVLLVQLAGGESGELRVVYPPRASIVPRRGAVEVCLRKRQAAAVDISGLDDPGDARTTIEPDAEAAWIVPTLCGPLVADPGRAPWGVLYTSSERAGRRPFDEHDVWLMDALCTLVAHLLAQVSAAQVLSLHRSRYAALVEHAIDLGLVGSSAALGVALETLGALAEEDAPVMLLAPGGSEPERWATLLHRLSSRSGASFVRADLARGGQGEVFASTLRSALEAAAGGTLLLDGLDALQDAPRRDALRDALQLATAQRVRLLSSSRHTTDALAEDLGLDTRVLERLARHVVRLPALAERPGDVAPLVHAILRELVGADSAAPLAAQTAQVIAGFDIPGDVAGLRRALSAALERGGAAMLADANALDRQLGTWYPRQSSTRVPPRPRVPEAQGFHPLAPLAPATDVALTPLADAFRRAGLLG